jgi:hypothetical protein
VKSPAGAASVGPSNRSQHRSKTPITVLPRRGKQLHNDNLLRVIDQKRAANAARMRGGLYSAHGKSPASEPEPCRTSANLSLGMSFGRVRQHSQSTERRHTARKGMLCGTARGRLADRFQGFILATFAIPVWAAPARRSKWRMPSLQLPTDVPIPP